MINRQNFDSAEHRLMKMYGDLCDIYDELDTERKQYWPKSKEIQAVCDRVFDLQFDVTEVIHAIFRYHEMCDALDKKENE